MSINLASLDRKVAAIQKQNAAQKDAEVQRQEALKRAEKAAFFKQKYAKAYADVKGTARRCLNSYARGNKGFFRYTEVKNQVAFLTKRKAGEELQKAKAFLEAFHTVSEELGYTGSREDLEVFLEAGVSVGHCLSADPGIIYRASVEDKVVFVSLDHIVKAYKVSLSLTSNSGCVTSMLLEEKLREIHAADVVNATSAGIDNPYSFSEFVEAI